MEAPDEQLMLAYRDGDAGAFETLYARHRGALYRFVLRSINDRGIAEELFQEAWIRVIEARERYAPSAKFTTWLYTIAHNLLVDHWRVARALPARARGAAARAARSVSPARGGRLDRGRDRRRDRDQRRGGEEPPALCDGEAESGRG